MSEKEDTRLFSTFSSMFIKHVHVDILSCVECVVQATTALIVSSNKSALDLVLLSSSNNDSQSTCMLTISAVFSLQIIS